MRNGRLEEKFKVDTAPWLLIIDAIGYPRGAATSKALVALDIRAQSEAPLGSPLRERIRLVRQPGLGGNTGAEAPPNVGLSRQADTAFPTIFIVFDELYSLVGPARGGLS